MLFFFFKQKTAYEMRISDWSSDVCSSDLCRWADCCCFPPIIAERSVRQGLACCRRLALFCAGRSLQSPAAQHSCRYDQTKARISEEHTSELQSLMRISYAVFCLKKKNKIKNENIINLQSTSTDEKPERYKYNTSETY